MKPSLFVTALVLQVAALAFGGIWGAAGAGVLIGLAMRSGGAFRTGFLTALIATALLLGVAAVRGAPIMHFADKIGGNFKLSAGALLAVTLILPALQSGGIAGGLSRLTRR